MGQMTQPTVSSTEGQQLVSAWSSINCELQFLILHMVCKNVNMNVNNMNITNSYFFFRQPEFSGVVSFNQMDAITSQR